MSVPARISKATTFVIGVAAVAWLLLPVPAARALTPLSAIRYTSDSTVNLGGTLVTPQNIVQDNLDGTVALVSIGVIPVDVDVIAYHQAADGNQLLAFDADVTLPGDVTARPGDVVRFNGSTYSLQFDAAANGVPGGVKTDAVTQIAGGDLLLSFDTTVTLGSVTANPGDLVRFNGSSFTLYFNAAAAGVPPELSLDGADYLDSNGHLLLSFDGSGTIGGVAFNANDVLEYTPSGPTWEKAYNGTAQFAAWAPANLVAPAAVPRVAQATCAAPSCGSQIETSVGSYPYSTAVADFNADGKPDLAVANNGDNTVSVLLGNGSGGFGTATNFPVGNAPTSAAVGDFNGDGKPDLAVANSGDGTVSLLLGDGSGGFGAASNFSVGTFPFSLAVGDFNGDGVADLAVANIISNNVSILLSTGSGFTAATNFSVGNAPVSVAVGNFNGDGAADIAVANSSDNTVSILLGNGSGGFAAATNFAVGAYPRSVAVRDLNGDGKPDLAVANMFGSTVSILLGNGSGGFGAAADFAVGTNPTSVAAGDFNGDFNPDLAATNSFDGTMSMLLGDGGGGFGAATNFGVGVYPASVVAKDLNGDGRLDVVVGNVTSNTVSILLNTCVSAQGQTCAINTDCASSTCVDGICCDASCTGTCQSCALAKTGQPNGTCAAVGVGLRTTNNCNTGSLICNGTTGVGSCTTLVAQGQACTSGAQCASGFCVDAVCCNSACGSGVSDDCQACSVAAGGTADGTCTPSTGNACDDNNACTTDDTCSGGSCVGGPPLTCNDSDPCTQDSCNAGAGCVYSATSATSCANSAPGRAQLTVHTDTDTAKNKVQFKWIKGSFPVEDFGTPTTATDYTLCVYDKNGAVVGLTAPGGPMMCGTKPCWSLTGSPATGIKYKDAHKPPLNDGMKGITGKADTSGKGKLQVNAQGSTVSTITLGSGLTYPVTAQVVTTGAGCWQADFTAADEKKNDGLTFKATHTAP